MRFAVLATAVLLGTTAELPAQHRVVLRGQRFTPARVEATVGDSVRFELESGAPHNVAFYPDSIPRGALAPLAKNLRADPRLLFTPDMLLFPGEAFVLSLADLPPGTYVFYCAPHLGGGMRGELVVRARTP
jgi:plastocyanin